MPILFRERGSGQSKMDLRVALAAVRDIVVIRFRPPGARAGGR
ncbi:MAG: hypothetical protein U0802_06500 [Candidatus Binatia bacterium]